MSSRTRIVVLHMKEIVYTGIFVGFLVVLGIVVWFMFGRGNAVGTAGRVEDAERYVPGVYRSSVGLNGSTFDVEVTVDGEMITGVRLRNLSESVAAMFPLVEPTLEDVAGQIYEGRELDEVSYGSGEMYTARMLIGAIEEAVERAER